MGNTFIGEIENYSGGLFVFELDGKFYWQLESPLYNDSHPEEIPKSLYDELLKFEQNRPK
jgi:hypothetical protein